MTAAWLSMVMRRNIEDIVLIESDDIGIVGVGEATIPSIRKFNQWLGLDEDELLKRTQGTFKLGIEFVDWGQVGNRYHHSFGPNGHDVHGLPFHALWLRSQMAANGHPLGDYNLQTQACLDNRFMRPNGANSPLATIAYAFHFDASLYARYLREICEPRGVKRIEGTIVDVARQPENGFIDNVTLSDGTAVSADLFIDCSGFRSLLLGQALQTRFVDWSHWLPCDRALAVPSERRGPIEPYTRSTAHAAGWQWRIPLQHRTGNGHVFASAFMDQDRAANILMANLDGKALADPKALSFRAGRREAFWVGNCVAIGLSGGFLEPLESTSIFLIQNAIARLHVLFPDKGFAASDIAFFNRESVREYEDVRDFIILHYKLNQRTDAPMWDYCRNMPVPDRLEHRMRLFESRGRIFEEKGEQFGLSSWLAVLWGQGMRPQAADPLTLAMGDDEIMRWLAGVRETIANCCRSMPRHQILSRATVRR
ncbi:MAG: tryptophan 7-halogenase [Asticcacaulis sp.]|nr:tryptophan 7-halogenase [Asticcacaulis sp.]